ncbi:anthranilate/para-aminobenzoate synthases component II [Cenarchaeum symbiosum A]|uniref:anthranilate synthase n=1 Tax=Cenarchaeum symbiosum (strain A) TaxID=414004 RepID=A0RX35_CENSY|nr:anthranilate/para-aminobenzoate synthases component II [Cenarchaeum symbiosum A]
MKVLVIDNYDSFVYNIAQYIGELGAECTVVRNDAITVDEVKSGGYDAIVISPGPGTPDEGRYFGICSEVIKQVGPQIPVLGVCLGHQGIISAFGGRVANAGQVRHGKTSMIKHTDTPLFEGVKNPFRATRYHSLAGDRTAIPPELEVTAVAQDDSEIMAVRHRTHPIVGVQFHPESIMTEDGRKIIANFLRGAGAL